MIRRFSSRTQKLDHSFLTPRLHGAQAKDRIAGLRDFLRSPTMCVKVLPRDQSPAGQATSPLDPLASLQEGAAPEAV